MLIQQQESDQKQDRHNVDDSVRRGQWFAVLVFSLGAFATSAASRPRLDANGNLEPNEHVAWVEWAILAVAVVASFSSVALCLPSCMFLVGTWMEGVLVSWGPLLDYFICINILRP
jgi:hypothetical protein